MNLNMKMILIEDSKKFELKILGYEFEGAESFHDSNWLNVFISVEDGDLKWSAEDPCLSASELNRLLEWLKGLPNGIDRTISFTEHELAFEFDSELSLLTILLVYKFHPKANQEDEDLDYRLSFYVDSKKICDLVSELSTWTELYPLKHPAK